MLDLSPMFGVSYVMFVTITAWFGVSILVLPYPLIFVAPELWRSWRDWIGGKWLAMPTSILELAGIKYVFTGDKVRCDETCVMMSNHRNRLDWLFLWAWLMRFGRLHNEKIVLKAPLRKAFAPGWATQLLNFLFLYRKWDDDKVHVARYLKYHRAINYPLQLLIFPEGTDFGVNGKARSDAYAEKMGLRMYDFVMHPKVTGFVYMVSRLRGHVEAVYDITIAYPDGIPQGEMEIVRGHFPREIHVDVKRYAMNELPESDDELGEWCKARFAEKEEMLKDLYARAAVAKAEGKPLPTFNRPLLADPPGTRMALFKAVAFWCGVMAVCILLLQESPLYRWYFLAYNAGILTLNFGFGVYFDQIETALGLRGAPTEKVKAN